ncbi:MAG: hypothetical protein PHH91_14625 [Desulfuromonadaceae bacterium]|nr:hypothetical protein [Desulfuromonadaceae bacterium]
MKKFIISIAALSMFASAALAADPASLDNTKTGLSLYAFKGTTAGTSDDKSRVAKTSTGVMLAAKSSDVGYSLVAQHKSGTKVFGSANDSTSIYSKPVTTKGTGETLTLTTDKTVFTGDDTWTTM